MVQCRVAGVEALRAPRTCDDRTMQSKNAMKHSVTPKSYTLKGRFRIPGTSGDSWAHPVVAGGQLYLREKDTLLVYDVAAR